MSALTSRNIHQRLRARGLGRAVSVRSQNRMRRRQLCGMLVPSIGNRPLIHTSSTTTTWRCIRTSASFSPAISHFPTLIASTANFLYENYKQALDVIHSGPTSLEYAMADLQISDPAVFEQWREEERVYLQGLSQEPLQETLEMEYYQKLVNLSASR